MFDSKCQTKKNVCKLPSVWMRHVYWNWLHIFHLILNLNLSFRKQFRKIKKKLKMMKEDNKLERKLSYQKVPRRSGMGPRSCRTIMPPHYNNTQIGTENKCFIWGCGQGSLPTCPMTPIVRLVTSRLSRSVSRFLLVHSYKLIFIY